MRQPGRQDDHCPAAWSIIARIDRALTDLPEVRPGAGPYLRRLAECGWSGGTQHPARSLSPCMVGAERVIYRHCCDDPL